MARPTGRTGIPKYCKECKLVVRKKQTRDSVRRYRAGMTPERKARYQRESYEHQRRYRAKRTPEQRAADRVKRREYARQYRERHEPTTDATQDTPDQPPG